MKREREKKKEKKKKERGELEVSSKKRTCSGGVSGSIRPCRARMSYLLRS